MPAIQMDNPINPTLFKSYHYRTRSAGSGATYLAGYYDAPAADVELNQASLTQTYGAANVPYAAHAFIVAEGVGTTDGTDLVLTVSGTSITDAGVRTPADSQVITANCVGAATDQYFETPKKWIGQITFTLSSTAGTAYDFTFNYGFCKYDDIGNRHFFINDLECVGLAEQNDGSFDIELLHHKETGWTYDAAAFVPGAEVVKKFSTIHSTESDLDADEPFAFKVASLQEEIEGHLSEGFLIRVTSGTPAAVGRMDAHIGVTLI